MESRTGNQLITAVRFGSDNDGLTLRHPDVDVLREINTSIRSFRGWMTANHFRYFLESTTAATLAGTAVAGEDFSAVPWPATAESLHGIDVAPNDTDGGWESLDPITWGQRRNYRWLDGYPEQFSIMTLPRGSGASTTAGSIALFPKASSGFYKIWFIPQFTDLTGTDVFLGLPDWHVWVICDAQQVLIGRDDDQDEAYSIVTARKAEAAARILASLPGVQQTTPLRPRRGRRTRRFRR